MLPEMSINAAIHETVTPTEGRARAYSLVAVNGQIWL